MPAISLKSYSFNVIPIIVYPQTLSWSKQTNVLAAANSSSAGIKRTVCGFAAFTAIQKIISFENERNWVYFYWSDDINYVKRFDFNQHTYFSPLWRKTFETIALCRFREAIVKLRSLLLGSESVTINNVQIISSHGFDMPLCALFHDTCIINYFLVVHYE